MTSRDAPDPDFAKFFSESKDAILRAVMVSTSDVHDAEDCVAEAFARAFSRWDVVSKHPAPEAWVMRTATNLHTDRLRRHQRFLSHQHEFAVPEVASEPALPFDAERINTLRSLPDRQRQVLAMRIFLGLSGPTTAIELGISEGTVATHLHRALAALRTVLAANSPLEPNNDMGVTQ